MWVQEEMIVVALFREHGVWNIPVSVEKEDKT
jgi:hypothetical protein